MSIELQNNCLRESMARQRGVWAREALPIRVVMMAWRAPSPSKNEASKSRQREGNVDTTHSSSLTALACTCKTERTGGVIH